MQNVWMTLLERKNKDNFMISIKIETLLEGRKVEHNRIGYKGGFNLSEIVHTICGYKQ